jgi:hypothetical protein
MIKKFIILFFVFGLNNNLYSKEINCDEFKKFSIGYMKCKANLIKDKTVTSGQNFVEETKDYQKKEWSETKIKVNKIKQKVLNEF